MRSNFDVEFQNEQSMNVQFTESIFNCDFGEGIRQGDYSGQTNVIPSEELQTLPTSGKTLETNITIQPVPNNYARMTWQGSTLIIY